MLRRKRGRLKWLVALPVAVLGLFLLLQLLLATPWARSWAAAKVEGRIGLESSIGRLGWSPWGGLEIHRLRIEKPRGLGEEPLLAVHRTRIWPKYRSLLGGHPEIQGMEVDRARVELDLELLIALANRVMTQVEPPAVATLVQGVPATGTTRSPAAGPLPEVSSFESMKPTGSVAAEGRTQQQVAWLTLKDCEVALRARSTEWARVVSFCGAVPLNGEAESQLVGKAQILLETTIEANVGIGFRRAPYGQLKSSMNLSGKKIQSAGNAIVNIEQVASFQTAGSIRIGDRVRWASSTGEQFGFESLESNWRAMGLLRFPGSWVAEGDCRVMRGELATDSITARMDEGWAQLSFRRGRLESPDFGLSGSPFSVRGNGWQEHGVGAVVARLTMPAAFTEGAPSPCGVISWRPLEPGAMAFADLTLWSDDQRKWWVELGEAGARVPWEEWTRCLRKGPELGR